MVVFLPAYHYQLSSEAGSRPSLQLSALCLLSKWRSSSARAFKYPLKWSFLCLLCANLQCPVPKWLFFLSKCEECLFNACLWFLFLPPGTFFWRHFTFCGVHPWGISPPNPPSSAPTQTKRVPICSFLNSASIYILVKDWNQSVAEIWFENWDTDANAYMIHQAPITGLHSPKLLPFFQHSTKYLMLARSWKMAAPLACLTPQPAP